MKKLKKRDKERVYQYKCASNDMLIKLLSEFKPEAIGAAIIQEIKDNGLTNIERDFIDRTVSNMIDRIGAKINIET